MGSGRVIGSASGVLAARRGISPAAACDLMDDASQRTNRKLRLAAEDVLRSGGL